MDREKIITAAELMDMQFLPRSTVVDGMLPAGCYILAGAPKVGKSFLMAQLCWCVATGTPSWDSPPTAPRCCICLWRTRGSASRAG